MQCILPLSRYKYLITVRSPLLNGMFINIAVTSATLKNCKVYVSMGFDVKLYMNLEARIIRILQAKN